MLFLPVEVLFLFIEVFLILGGVFPILRGFVPNLRGLQILYLFSKILFLNFDSIFVPKILDPQPPGRNPESAPGMDHPLVDVCKGDAMPSVSLGYFYFCLKARNNCKWHVIAVQLGARNVHNAAALKREEFWPANSANLKAGTDK